MAEEVRLEKAADLDSRAKKAKESEIEAEKLIIEFTPFLKSQVAKYSTRYDEHQREALFSVAMSAFYEAISSYDAQKGRFFPFADRVVRLRIIDHIRRISRHIGKTVSLDEDDEERQGAQSAIISELSVRSYNEQQRREMLAQEIEQFKIEIASWGITMDALVLASPKHKELRNTYYEVIASISLNPDIMQTIKLKRYFPIKAISEITGIPSKKLERARTFILASLIIKTGDYDLLPEFIKR